MFNVLISLSLRHRARSNLAATVTDLPHVLSRMYSLTERNGQERPRRESTTTLVFLLLRLRVLAVRIRPERGADYTEISGASLASAVCYFTRSEVRGFIPRERTAILSGNDRRYERFREHGFKRNRLWCIQKIALWNSFAIWFEMRS